MFAKEFFQNSWRFLLQCLTLYSHSPTPPPPPPRSPHHPPSPPPNNFLNYCPVLRNTVAAESSPTLRSHSITLQMRELKLGKNLLTIGVTITATVLFSNDAGKKNQTAFAYFTLSGLSIGSLAIWNGIALRSTFPRTANTVEQLGIIMVLLSFAGLLGSVLPPEFMWVTILCSALSLLPFLIQIFSHCTKRNQIQTDATSSHPTHVFI